MNATCWQVHIEGWGWVYAAPEDAAMCHVCRPGSVRLTTVQVPRVALFEHWRQRPTKAATPPSMRRLVAAEKALERQRENAGLFAGQLQQPSPAERIAHFDNACDDGIRERRLEEAHKRRAVKRELAALPERIHTRVMLQWSGWRGPRDAFYLRHTIKKVQAELC